MMPELLTSLPASAMPTRRICSAGWCSEGRVALASLVAPEGEAVDRECVGQQVEVLAGVTDGVGSAEPAGVVEGAVVGLGVVASAVEALEVGFAPASPTQAAVISRPASQDCPLIRGRAAVRLSRLPRGR